MSQGSGVAVTQEQVDALKWWHSIDLGDGVVSKGHKSLITLQVEANVIFQHGVEGKSVIDIGAWDGAQSFHAQKRGAKAITAVDGFIWPGHGWSSKKPFDLANAAHGNRVEARMADIYDMTPGNSGMHDVVLFLGVLYHLKHPLLALEHVAALTSDYAVIETATGHNDNPLPMMQFLPGSELANDPTNWCLPNFACVKAWLLTAGFKRVEVTQHPHDNAGNRHYFHAWKH